MKVLFDANVPAKLRNHLPGHEVTRAQTLGWQELKNGALLDAAERDKPRKPHTAALAPEIEPQAQIRGFSPRDSPRQCGF